MYSHGSCLHIRNFSPEDFIYAGAFLSWVVATGGVLFYWGVCLHGECFCPGVKSVAAFLLVSGSAELAGRGRCCECPPSRPALCHTLLRERSHLCWSLLLPATAPVILRSGLVTSSQEDSHLPPRGEGTLPLHHFTAPSHFRPAPRSAFPGTPPVPSAA